MPHHHASRPEYVQRMSKNHPQSVPILEATTCDELLRAARVIYEFEPGSKERNLLCQAYSVQLNLLHPWRRVFTLRGE